MIKTLTTSVYTLLLTTPGFGAAWDTEADQAAVLSFDPNGNDEKTYAIALRSCQAMTIQPETGQLWRAVNERDDLNEDPRHKGARPDLKNNVKIPDVFMQAHSASLQTLFYEGDNFPSEYNGSAFVTVHGSWNREERTGYKVVLLLFGRDVKPAGEYDDFVRGFVISDKEVWGRPVGVAAANDGSLLVTEDGNGTIWRVSHSHLQTR